MNRTATDRVPAGRLALAGLALLSGLSMTGPGSAAAATLTPTPTPAPTATPTAAPGAGRLGGPLLPLAAPTGLSPLAAGAALKEVVLHWAPVPHADGYHVEVGTEQEWAGDPVFGADTVATTLTLPASLPHASYVWRVTALQAGGHGRWSADGAFARGWDARPVPLRPGGDAGLARGSEFAWTPVPGASEYQLQISNVPTFDESQPATAQPVVDNSPTQTQSGDKTESCFTTRTRVTPSVPHGNAKVDAPGDCSMTLVGTGEDIYWRVRALDHYAGDKQVLPTTPVVDEGISHLPPDFIGNHLDLTACPKRTAPTNGIPDPAATPTPSATPTAAVPTPTGIPTKPLSCDPAHPVEKGAWSATTRFRLSFLTTSGDATRLPVVRTDPLPSDLCSAQQVCRDFPTLTWPATPGAYAYRVYVALDPSYSNVAAVSDVYGLSWTPLVSWRDSTAGSSYYYAVQACTTTGCGPVTSTPPSFRKSSPKLALLAPAPGARFGAGDVQLDWQGLSGALQDATGAPATSEAYAYHLQVTTADNPDFQGGLIEDTVVDSTSHVSPTVSYPDGTLLWRVQAVDASSNRLPWSAARTFVRDSVAPRVTLTPSARLSVTGTLVVRFSEPVTGLTAASLRLDPAGPLDVTVVGSTARIVPLRALMPGATYTLVVGAGVRDLAGNAVAASTVPVTVDPAVDDGSPALRYTGSWSTRSATDAYGGGFRTSSPSATARSTVSAVVFGRGVAVLGCVGPTGGLLELRVDGLTRRIDTYRSYSGCGVLFPRVTGLAARSHSVTLRGLGTHSAASRGTTVSVDAVAALR